MTPALGALAYAARTAPAITLEELQSEAELLNRFDRKYLVPAEVFADFSTRLRGFRALAIDGRRTFRYHSLYYDTPALRSFHDHRQGRRRRFKIRERLYEDSGERQFEIKLKGLRGLTLKRRRALQPGELAIAPPSLAFLAEVLHTAYGQAPPGPLFPSLTTDYVRTTLVAPGQRVTCDAALVCRDLRRGGGIRAAGSMILVETKSAGGLTPADRLLHAYGLRPAVFTKYCAALAALRPDLPANNWRRAARAAFQEEPGALRSAADQSERGPLPHRPVRSPG